jgi:hypothetical protein
MVRKKTSGKASSKDATTTEKRETQKKKVGRHHALLGSASGLDRTIPHGLSGCTDGCLAWIYQQEESRA